VHVFDSATVPASGTVPNLVLLAQGNFSGGDDYPTPMEFANGIAVGLSSTPGTYTPVGAGDMDFIALQPAGTW
jgi:hypothetical protein